MYLINRRALLALFPLLLYLASGTAIRAAPIDLTVMTQNLYFGADTTPVLTAPDLATAALRAAEAFQQVQANNFPVRAAAIASEVQAAGGPLLIGLQEASIISGKGVTLDYAKILLNQLASLGLNYTIAGIHTGTTVALAGFSLTDRDIVLARTGIPGFSVTGSEAHTFAHNVTLPTVFGPITDSRGYVLVDATSDGVPFQFVSTHLDSFHTPLQPLQADEILAALSTGTEPQLVVGDFNATSAEQTYQKMLAAGFVDTAAALGAVGPTCCQAPDLGNSISELSERIDYIFQHNFSSIDSVFRVGDTPFQAVPPLWPSDHAGVVATVNVPEPPSVAMLTTFVLVGGLPMVGFWARLRYRVTSAIG